MTPRDLPRKFDLVLKALNISRGRLAADLGLSKSVISRWVSGTHAPSAHNLVILSDLIARRRPGFSVLDWDRDIDELAAMLGAPNASGAAPARPLEFDRQDILAASRVQSRIEVERDGGAYPGVYVGYRQSFRNSGRIIPDLFVFHREGDRLFFAIHDPVFSHRGEVFILRHQLFLFGEDAQRVDGLNLHVLNGVAGRKAVRLDGLMLSVHGDRHRTPTAAAVALQRLMDLDDPEAPPPADRLTAVLARLQHLYDADQLPVIAGEAIVAAVSPAVTGPAGATFLDHLLRAAVLGTDDCFPVYVAAPDVGP